MVIDRRFSRRSVFRLTVAGAGVVAASRYLTIPVFAAPPPLEKKDTYTIGFAQTGSNNPWRLGESKSMQDEAKRLGRVLTARCWLSGNWLDV